MSRNTSYVMTPQFAWFFTLLLALGGFWGYKLYQRKVLKPFESKVEEIQTKRKYENIRNLTIKLTKKLPTKYKREFLTTLAKYDDLVLSSKRRKEIIIAQYSLVLYTLYLFGKYGASLATYPAIITILVLIVLWLYPFLSNSLDKNKNLPNKKLPQKYLPRKIPKEWKKACDYVYSVISAEPVRPASIYYHEQRTGGLLRHSLNVMIHFTKKTAKKMALNDDEIGLVTFLGLAHDAGKRFVYYPVYERKLFGRKKIVGWKSRFSPIPAHTKVVIAEALNYAGLSEKIKIINPIIDPNPLTSLSEFQRTLKNELMQSDGFVTFNEMFLVPKSMEKDYVNAFKEAIWRLNINRVYSGQTEGYYFPDKKLLIVFAWALAQKVSDVLVEKYGIPKAYQYGVGARTKKRLHPITPPLSVALKKHKFIYSAYKGAKGDKLCLFNGEMQQEGYNNPMALEAFFIINLEKVDQRLKEKWARGMDFIRKIEYLKIKSRKGPTEQVILAYYEELKKEDGIITEFEFGLEEKFEELVDETSKKEEEVEKLL